MGIFDFFIKPNRPAVQRNSIGEFYEMLFCDDVELYRKLIHNQDVYPWNLILNSTDLTELKRIIGDPEVESRAKILAYHQLASLNAEMNITNLLAVIIEISFKDGTDVLAAYQDGSVRYINQSGKILIHDNSDTRSKAMIEELFVHADRILEATGPWNRSRLNPPKESHARITLLVSNKLHFGEAETDELFDDPIASPTLRSATDLLTYLTQKTPG